MNFRLLWIKWDDDGDGYSRPELSGSFRQTPGSGYEQRGDSMLRREPMRSGDFRFTPLTNFAARIIGDLLLDDGERERREFGMEAELGGRKITFPLAAAEFGRMNWVLDRLGPEAIVYPGKQQHARAAIQSLSRQIRQERIFTHLGWTKQCGEWVYLHAGGALAGSRSGISVQPPSALELYKIEPSRGPGDRMKAIRASLRCLALAPDRISFPLLAAVYRAVFGKADFSVFLTGSTGVFKTQLAAIAQQHFGSGLDAAHLPGNFASTVNALETLAFHAKDALVVVDDFAPSGRHGDDRLESVAERLFRAVGNHQGRSRMSGNRAQQPRPPRALLVATGEQVPAGHSIRARLLIVEIAPGHVDLATLSECQHAGTKGHLTASLGAFLVWMAARYEEQQERFEAHVRELRGQGLGRTIHARLPEALAQLESAFELWLEFASEAGAIDEVEHIALKERSRCAFEELALLQSGYHQASDPARRFIELLRTALASGQTHVASRRGTAPDSPRLWGWRRNEKNREWIPRGTRIGWIVRDDLFLDPAASYQTAQNGAGSEQIPLSPQTLHHRLREAGLLASVDTGRQMVQVRRTLEGQPRQVLHFKAKDLAKLPSG